jgi:hypothetical protein
LKRIRSGVEVPDPNANVLGLRGARDVEDVCGEGWLEKEEPVGERREGSREEAESVVLRCMFVVSDEGGGGRLASGGMEEAERIDALQRKHSPVPK